MKAVKRLIDTTGSTTYHREMSGVSERIQLLVLLHKAGSLTDKFLASYLRREAGVDYSDWLVMQMIGSSIPQSKLGQELGLSPAGVTGAIDKLIARRLLVRKSDANDRRKNTIELTKLGQALLTQADQLMGSVTSYLLSGVPAPDQSHLASSLTELIKQATTEI